MKRSRKEGKDEKKKPHTRWVGERLLKTAEWIRGPEFYKNSRAAAEIELLYPGKAGQVRLRQFYVYKLERAAGAMFIGIVLAILAVLLQPGNLGENSTILRESYGGSEKTVHLEVSDEEGYQQQVEIEVSARTYTEEQAAKLLEETIRDLDSRILGENSAFTHIDRDLMLPGEVGPVTLVWESGNYHVMDTNGRLHTEEVPEEGITFTIQANLTCEGCRDTYQKKITVFPPMLSEAEAYMKQVEESVRTADTAGIHGEYLQLPSVIGKSHVQWTEVKDGMLPLLLFLTAILAVGLYWNEDQKLHERLVKRAAQMDADYADILNKLVLLLGAGMTIRSAWTRIAEEYESCHKEERYAYEEMVLSLNELQRGIPEIQVYEHFGRRCANASYLKLSALLTQNLRKGSKGLLELFRRESADAFQRRKNEVRRKGEEAGTKLLLPMFLMLAVVLMIVTVPAFLSMQL